MGPSDLFPHDWNKYVERPMTHSRESSRVRGFAEVRNRANELGNTEDFG